MSARQIHRAHAEFAQLALCLVAAGDDCAHGERAAFQIIGGRGANEHAGVLELIATISHKRG